MSNYRNNILNKYKLPVEGLLYKVIQRLNYVPSESNLLLYFSHGIEVCIETIMVDSYCTSGAARISPRISVYKTTGCQILCYIPHSFIHSYCFSVQRIYVNTSCESFKYICYLNVSHHTNIYKERLLHKKYFHLIAKKLISVIAHYSIDNTPDFWTITS